MENLLAPTEWQRTVNRYFNSMRRDREMVSGGDVFGGDAQGGFTTTCKVLVNGEEETFQGKWRKTKNADEVPYFTLLEPYKLMEWCGCEDKDECECEQERFYVEERDLSVDDDLMVGWSSKEVSDWYVPTDEEESDVDLFNLGATIVTND
jgi:hypothetical protein